jgi:hypothetical protein
MRVVDMFVTWWSGGHEIETVRALDEVEAKEIVRNFEPDLP